MEYQLLDSGDGQKLEKFGKLTLIRPSVQAVWSPRLSKSEWDKADARFSRDKGNHWELFRPLPETWTVELEAIRLHLKRTEFGHLGVFPEHATLWSWMQPLLFPKARVLNLFAYSGSTTLKCASLNAEVTHVDAAKGMVSWARENAKLNHLESASIRWIVDDARKYVKRAVRRQESYEAIILDPPTFGRGKEQEIFKIERDLLPLLRDCAQLLSSKPLFVICTCHTPGYTPLVVKQILQEVFPKGSTESGEMKIESQTDFDLPTGTFARWRP